MMLSNCGKKTFKAIVCILVFGVTLVHSEECPSAETIFPCLCTKGFRYDIDVRCKGLENLQHLDDIIAELKGHKIGLLKVDNSNLGDVPGDVFKGVNISRISFDNSRLTSLGDEANPPFTGIENSLTDLYIIDEKQITKPLRLGHLKKLNTLTLERMEISKLDNDWFSDGPDSLTILTIQNCSVKEVGDKAFSRLENLIALTFSLNYVTLERSVLPRKALHLTSIYFWKNGMQRIPTDFFQNLPVITEVNLWGNNLTGIPQDTWGSIWPQISSIELRGNPLVCDSKLAWMVHQQDHTKILGVCAAPESMKGRPISSLKNRFST